MASTSSSSIVHALVLLLFCLAFVRNHYGTSMAQDHGPCPGGVRNGCTWCASGGEPGLPFYGTCSNKRATFRRCAPGTQCRTARRCVVYCG